MCGSSQQQRHYHWGREHSGVRVGDEEGATGQVEALHATQTGVHDALYMQYCVCGHVHTYVRMYTLYVYTDKHGCIFTYY